jgi:hypothetical protein
LVFEVKEKDITYIIGQIRQGHAILAADSAVEAVTSANVGETTFGQSEVTRGDRRVYEGALKLLRLENAAVAVCGYLSAAQVFVEQFILHSSYAAIDEAIERALQDCQPLDADRPFSLLIASPDLPSAKLWVLDSSAGTVTQAREGDIIHRGSFPKPWDSIPPAWLAGFDRPKRTALQHCANLLAFLQGLTLYGSFMEHSVGGAFCGIVISPTEIDWQPDMCYVCYSSGPTAGKAAGKPHRTIISIVRNNVLYVDSSSPDVTKAMANSLTMDRSIDVRSEAHNQLSIARKGARFDYVVFLCTGGPRIVTVVEMLGNTRSKFVEFELPAAPNESTSELGRVMINPEVVEAICVGMAERGDGILPYRHNWFPYVPAPGATAGSPSSADTRVDVRPR